MSRAAKSLVDRGIVSETVDARSAIGRPRRILTLIPTARHVVGVKLTGDRAYAVACNLVGSVVASAQMALPKPGRRGSVSVAGSLTVVSRLVERLAVDLPGLDGVGISVGGVVQGRALVHEGTFLGWHDVDLAGQARDRLKVPVVVSNDVSALAREEQWFGAGRTHPTFGLVTVGAGLGFGLVREGKVVEELIDNGHLLSHSPIDSTGPQCALGHHGCAAAFLHRGEVETRMAKVAGAPASFADLVHDSRHRNTPWLSEAARALGHLVATFAGALQTPRIVLAGEDVAPLAGHPDFSATLADRLRPGPDETQQCALEVTTAPLTFGDWARGAAAVSLQHNLGAL